MSENQPRDPAEVTSQHKHDVALRNLYEYLDKDLTWHTINNFENIDDGDANKIGVINMLTNFYKRLGGTGSAEDAKRWAMNTISMVKGYSQKDQTVEGAEGWTTTSSGDYKDRQVELEVQRLEEAHLQNNRLPDGDPRKVSPERLDELQKRAARSPTEREALGRYLRRREEGEGLGPKPNASGAPFTLPEGYEGASSRGRGDVGFISEGDVDENGNPLTNLGLPEGPDGDAIAAEAAETQEKENKLFEDTLGFQDLGIRGPGDLPKGADVTDYYQVQKVIGVLQRWARQGKLAEWRRRLFYAGYYETDSEGAFDFDFSTDDITAEDTRAVAAAMTAANISDPKGATRLGPHVRDQTALNKAGQVAMLETSLATRMDELGLATTAGGVSKYVDDLMSGRSSFASLANDMRDTAMGLYPAFADQIRGGMSMNQIAKPYRDAAATILEVPNMGWDDPMLMAALNARGKDGTPTSMSLTAFKDAMRDDPRWDYTQNAHTYYGDLSGAVLEAWGF